MKRFIIPALAVLCAALAACGQNAERKTIFAMDAAAEISIIGENADSAFSAVEKELYRLDALMSRGRETSDVCHLNDNGSGEISADTAAVIKTALDISRETDGAFDITTAPLTDAWGFFNQSYRVPSDAEIQDILPRVGYENVTLNGNSVTLKGGARIDLGGIAKGYACGRAAEILRDSGIKSALISFGQSTIEAIGDKGNGAPWKIGIADPEDPTEYFMTLEITDECISTSGSYERYFEQGGKKYHHILGPSTGYPVENGLMSVSVICADPTRADALSTALFVMGRDKAAEFWKTNGGFDAIFITEGKKIYITPGLRDKISEPDGWVLETIE